MSLRNAFSTLAVIAALSARLLAQAPTPPIVKQIDVQFAGANTVSKEKILANMRTRVGKPYDERAVEEEFPGRTLNVRPGLIIGPHDPSDRFTYWPERIARGGEVLAPDGPDRVTQVIDARDLAAWMLRSLRAGLTGVFNATSPGGDPASAPPGAATPGFPLTFGRLFETCRDLTGSDARFTWLPEPFLAEQEVGAWMELPLWVPKEADSIGFDAVSVSRAFRASSSSSPPSRPRPGTTPTAAGRPRTDRLSSCRARRATRSARRPRSCLRAGGWSQYLAHWMGAGTRHDLHHPPRCPGGVPGFDAGARCHRHARGAPIISISH
jgi:hypothetical protein